MNINDTEVSEIRVFLCTLSRLQQELLHGCYCMVKTHIYADRTDEWSQALSFFVAATRNRTTRGNFYDSFHLFFFFVLPHGFHSAFAAAILFVCSPPTSVTSSKRIVAHSHLFCVLRLCIRNF